MKPFGSITNTFPFIEEEDKELVLRLVEESQNYDEFTEKLCDHVMATDSSEIMVHLAYSHVLNTGNYNAQKKVLDSYPEHPIIHLEKIKHQMIDNDDWQGLLKEIDDAIATNTNPLILFDLYCLRWIYIRSSSIGTLAEDNNIKNMTDLIQRNQSLEPFRSHVFFFIASRYYVECDNQKALQAYESALQLALTHDDVVFSASLQRHIAHITSRTDPSKALEIIESCAVKEREFGCFSRYTGLLGVMGLILDARGEYNAAVRSFEEAIERRQKFQLRVRRGLGASALSRTFRRMGYTKDALEWAKVAHTSKPMMSPRVQSIGVQVLANLCMSAALAILGRIEEAKSSLDVGTEFVLKTGSETWMCDVYLSRGLIERAEGNLPEALENFENALEITERLQRQSRMNECLFLLAETEVQHYMESPDSEGIVALHRITTMEDMARKKDLPGVLGLALLLKARMLLSQGHDEEAQATLSEVKELSENPGTLFLKDRIEAVSATATPKRRKRS
jgi:tetratricopeptide (TPR) repeat protein